MFWDSRVFFHPRELYFITPIDGLNGESPEYKSIVDNLTRPLAAQALFPLITKEEMLGEGYDHLSPKEIWKMITEKTLENKEYQRNFSELFSG